MGLPFTLVVPTDVEAGYVRDLHPVVCGIGQDAGRAAAQGVAAMGNGRAAVLAGFGGGLTDELAVGDIVVPGLVMRDGAALRCEHALAERERSLMTVDAVITDPSHKRATGETSGADAADMEGYAFAEACTSAGVPWLIVRAISDGVDHALPEAIGAWVTPEGKAKTASALAWAGIRPSRLAELRRLKGRADRAGAALAQAVRRLGASWSRDTAGVASPN